MDKKTVSIKKREKESYEATERIGSCGDPWLSTAWNDAVHNRKW